MHRNGYRFTTPRRILYGFGLAMAGLCISTAAAAGYHSTVVTVTAYNNVSDQTNGHSHLGAWGNHLGAHTIAASPDLIARGLGDGATVAIEGYDHDFVVRDKTSSRLHNTIDIYMGKNVKKARQFGRKRLRIWWHTSNE